jgi:hypothetical protein
VRGHRGLGAAVILAAGQKGKRFALPNAEVMIHQPWGGAQGQATDIEITAKHIIATRERLNKILSKATGQPLEKIEKDVDRDYFMMADEAKKYGIIDEIFTQKGLAPPPLRSKKAKEVEGSAGDRAEDLRNFQHCLISGGSLHYCEACISLQTS